MITLIYHVPYSERETELEWLREQKIFPGIRDGYDFRTHQTTAEFACIVSPETALTIKLRHKLDLQDNYKQR